jgi:hypothetical protein
MTSAAQPCIPAAPCHSYSRSPFSRWPGPCSPAYVNAISLRSIETTSGSLSAWPSGERG